MIPQTPPAGRSILARADLVRAMATGRDEMVSLVASQLGLEFRQNVIQKQVVTPFVLQDQVAPQSDNRLESSIYPNDIVNIDLWLTINYEQRLAQPSQRIDTKESRRDWKWSRPPAQVPSYQPIQSWRRIGPRLHSILDPFRQSHRIDIHKLVRSIARREFIHRLPRVERRRWNGELFVIADKSPHLIPYFMDQDSVARQLVQLMSNRTVTRLVGDSPYQLYDENSVQDGHGDEMTMRQPNVGCRVLVLGDLGALLSSETGWQTWHAWGQEMKQQGCELLALVPCSVRRLPRALLNLFTVQSWQGNEVEDVRNEIQRDQLVEKILTLAAPADRLEPGLLRDLRQLLPEAADVSLESDVWMSPLLSSNHPVAATIDRQVAKARLRPGFESLPIDLRRKALAVIRSWRKILELSPEVWLVEFLNLSDSSRSLVLESDSDLDDARALIRKFDEEFDSQRPVDGLKEYAKRFTRRASDDYALEDKEVGLILRKFRTLLNPDMEIHAATDPIELPAGDRESSLAIYADEKLLEIQSENAELSAIRLTQSIASSNTIFEVNVSESWTEENFWKAGGKPDFVSAFGRDQYGAWFEFQVSGRDTQSVVTQRMRWIRAGTFTMGSPDDEPERRDNEVLHQVTLTRGFWLADTACTQALWGAVMGVNQSQFQGDERPVEKVSYDDVVKFCSSLGKQIPGLMPQMPTEAQWEYACRAGTQTTFSFGSTISTDQANFDGNYPYNGSPKGLSRRETLSVKDLPCNPWGLYQMHGNVWEWCSDWYTDSLSESQIDPIGPSEGSARVIRGGSWVDSARDVRSACRYRLVPGYRGLNLGFRLLSSAGAEPSEMAEGPVAEQGSEPARLGAADEFFREFRVRVGDQEPAELEIAQATTIRVVSNLEAVELQRLTKPDWAVEFGRDVYGVYGDFELESAKDHSMVQQRLRWIPPGRFQMGSPPEEPGRFPNEDLKDVTISDGFWMFDAPCSQRLWTAIMDDNPSHFLDAERPVESVDWAQAKEFAARLNRALKAHAFQLPTEAQWEYACRAGTSTAIYTGTLEIIGDANAPALDPIAWYVGNSGHKYDLEQSEDIAKYGWLSKKQFPFTHAGTRKIKQKAPNPWGLYDMLGNVWEWCEDWYSEKLEGSSVDPRGPETGSDRVIRGGGWISDARLVRSACRSRLDPGDRINSLGFRLLSSASPGPVAERVVGSRRIPRDEAGENQRTK